MICSDFGTLSTGEKIKKYVLDNGKIRVCVINYGARITELSVPDRNGNAVDICLGCDSAEDYENDGQSFGAVVGRVANRIGGARFILDGKEYRLEKNEGDNQLHSASGTFADRVFSVESFDDISVIMNVTSDEGDAGYPGNLHLRVEYRLDDASLKIRYNASSDTKSLVNITNHSYFNLSGHDSGSVLDQYMCIDADRAVLLGKGLIPTGSVYHVSNTPMDFIVPKKIGDDIADSFDQINIAAKSGYDNPYLLSGDLSRISAKAWSEQTGIEMKMYTDSPAVQLYTANFLDGNKGKNGAVYDRFGAFCLESEYVPDAVNHDEFETCIAEKGRPWNGETIYSFSIHR